MIVIDTEDKQVLDINVEKPIVIVPKNKNVKSDVRKIAKPPSKQLPVLDWLLSGIGCDIEHNGKSVNLTYLYRLLLDDESPKPYKLSANVLQTYIPTEIEITKPTLARLVSSIRAGDYDEYIKQKAKESGVDLSKLIPSKAKKVNGGYVVQNLS